MAVRGVSLPLSVLLAHCRVPCCPAAAAAAVLKRTRAVCTASPCAPSAEATWPVSRAQLRWRSEEGEVHNPKAAALHRKLLACFKGGHLRRLTVVGCLAHSALSSQLAAFGSLRHLELRHTAAEEGCCGLHDSCLARQLLDRVEEEQLLPPGLQSLSLRLPQLPHPPLLLEDLADFSALTALELGGVSTVDDVDDPTEDLACLTSLRRLVLRAEVGGCVGGGGSGGRCRGANSCLQTAAAMLLS